MDRLGTVDERCSLPIVLFVLFAGRRIHPAYGMTWRRRLWLGLRIYRNWRRMPTGVSYKAHLAMAAQLLEIPPTVDGVVVEHTAFEQRPRVPPEAEFSEVEPRELATAIQTDGCLLARGLLPEAPASRLVHGIDAAFTAREAWLAGEPFDAEWYAPSDEFDASGANAPVARVYNLRLNALHVCDSPRMRRDVLELLRAGGLVQYLAEYFGEPPVLTIDKLMLRRIEPLPNPEPGWHQDGSFMGTGRSLNAWIALSPCGPGTGAPSLEIVPTRVDRVLECGAGAARNPIEIFDGLVDDAGRGTTPMSPRFDAGDALLFDDLFVHRTASGGSTRRYALETWFFAASSCPSKYVPIAL